MIWEKTYPLLAGNRLINGYSWHSGERLSPSRGGMILANAGTADAAPPPRSALRITTSTKLARVIVRPTQPKAPAAESGGKPVDGPACPLVVEMNLPGAGKPSAK